MLQSILVTSIFLYFLPFCVSTAISVYKNGMSAVHWTKGIRQSGLTNIAMSVTHILIAPAVFLLNDAFRQLYEALHIPHVPVAFWNGLPLTALFVFAVILHDFADYWCHRLLHTKGFWSIHAVHHSDTDMNHTTSLRIHVLESVMMSATYTLFLSWIGLPPVGAAGLALFFGMYNRFVHIDADIHFGPLIKVIATPRFHQWHHAEEEAAHNTNFANIFAFWDVVFGTYRVPGPCNVPLGFEGTPRHSYFKLMLWPGIELMNWSRNHLPKPAISAAPKQSG